MDSHKVKRQSNTGEVDCSNNHLGLFQTTTDCRVHSQDYGQHYVRYAFVKYLPYNCLLDNAPWNCFMAKDTTSHQPLAALELTRI